MAKGQESAVSPQRALRAHLGTMEVQADAGPRKDTRNKYLYWWLLVALVFEYSRPGSWVPLVEVVKLNSLIPLGLFVVTLFASGLRSPKEIFADPMVKWLIAYLVLIAISMTHATVTLFAVDRFIQSLGYCFLCWIIARVVTTPERLRGVFVILIFAHVFLLIMNPLVVLDPANRHYINGATFLGDGNDFSLSLCILLPMAIDRALVANSKWVKWFWFAIGLVLLLAIIGTQSRGATLGIVAVAGYIWWHTPRKMLTLFVIFVVASGVALYASEAYFKRMATISHYEEESSAQGRIEAWKGATRMAVDNPILGVGAGQFPTQFGTKYKGEVLGGRYLTAHSMYFLTLGELGFPGLITLVVIVFGNIKRTHRLRVTLEKTEPGPGKPMHRTLLLMNAGMIGFAVAGAFLSVSYYPHIFVLTGLFMAARSMAGPAVTNTAPARRFSQRKPTSTGGDANGRRSGQPGRG